MSAPVNMGESRRSWHFVVRALLYLALYDVIELLRKDHGPRRMLRRDPFRRRVAPVPYDVIVRAVEIACALYIRPATCFHRSTVLTVLLRRAGIPAIVVVGYRTPPFESHAWVEVGEVVVNDRQAFRKHFNVLDRLPSTAGQALS